MATSLILCIVTGFFGNYFWEKYKKQKQGDKPYFNLHVSQEGIYFEGQVQNTASNSAAILQIAEKTNPSSH